MRMKGDNYKHMIKVIVRLHRWIKSNTNRTGLNGVVLENTELMLLDGWK